MRYTLFLTLILSTMIITGCDKNAEPSRARIPSKEEVAALERDAMIKSCETDAAEGLSFTGAKHQIVVTLDRAIASCRKLAQRYPDATQVTDRKINVDNLVRLRTHFTLMSEVEQKANAGDFDAAVSLLKTTKEDLTEDGYREILAQLETARIKHTKEQERRKKWVGVKKASYAEFHKDVSTSTQARKYAITAWVHDDGKHICDQMKLTGQRYCLNPDSMLRIKHALVGDVARDFYDLRGRRACLLINTSVGAPEVEDFIPEDCGSLN